MHQETDIRCCRPLQVDRAHAGVKPNGAPGRDIDALASSCIRADYQNSSVAEIGQIHNFVDGKTIARASRRAANREVSALIDRGKASRQPQARGCCSGRWHRSRNRDLSGGIEGG